ncbi:MAG: DASS family sodium-coupled anion symporter [Veillonellales bacterium]
MKTDKTDYSAMLKWAILAVIVFILSQLPAPTGLKQSTMVILGIYVAAIVGLIIRPAGESVVLIIVAGLGSLFTKPANVLNGFSTTTVWLVFIAFLISMAFVKTGIGTRISYYLIGKFGRTTLGLGYVMAIVDLIISPATPSNTARSGGIVYPVFRSITATLGSEPGPTGKKIGSYFTMLQGLVSFTTAGLFITACSPNLVTLDFAKKILGANITWASWAMAMLIPGLVILFTVPFLLYKIYPPELKAVPNAKEISAQGLQKLGPMKKSEKILIILFVLAIAGWALGDILKVDATCVALAFFGLALLFKLFTIQDVLENKSAWNTLLWFGFIVGLSASLAKEKFFVWMAKFVQGYLALDTMSMVTVLAIIVGVCLLTRYLFASMGAFVTAFVPVAFTIGLAAKLPSEVLTYMVAACTAYGCALTHYGGALGPVLYGTGFVKQSTWWKIGGIYAVYNVLVYFVIGLPYWKIIGLW